MSNKNITPVDYMICFRGSRKYEEIYLNGQYHKIGVGDIMSAIYDAKIDDVFQRQLKDMNLFVDQVARHEKKVNELISLREMVDQLDMPPLIREIFFYQPVFEICSRVTLEYEETDFSPCEKEKFYKNDPADYHEQQLNSLRSDKSTLKWNQLARILTGKPDSLVQWQDRNPVLEDCINTYCKHFEDAVLSLRRLHWHLHKELPEGKTDMTGLKSCTVASTIRTGKLPHNLWPEPFLDSSDSVNVATRLADLVALEMDLLSRNDRELVPCSLCGRYFVPFRRNGKYCSRPNLQYGNQPCNEIGSTLERRENARPGELQGIYLKNHKAYSKWVKENKKNTGEAIRAEIDSKYTKWKEDTKTAWNDFREGRITEAALLQRIELPKVAERSPMLHRARLDERCVRGNIEPMDHPELFCKIASLKASKL